MGKRPSWPSWKIILVMVVAGALAVGLWVAGAIVDRQQTPLTGPEVPPYAGAYFTMGSMLKMFSLLSVGVVVIFGGWLGWRYYRSIPAWRRRSKLPPPRR